MDALKSAEDISKFIYYDNDVNQLSEEQEVYVEMIYDHLKIFRKECLCLNCIQVWLLSLIQENEDDDKVQEQITYMLEGKLKLSK